MTLDEEAPDREAALSRVRIPAWALVVSGALGLVAAATSRLWEPALEEALLRWFESIDAEFGAELRHELANPTVFDDVVDAASTFLGAAASLLILVGGLWMKDLKSWGLALTASILSMLCCGCCVVGFPAGIWSLVVLCRSDVKAAFAAAAKR